jgi:hypothetical protein
LEIDPILNVTKSQNVPYYMGWHLQATMVLLIKVFVFFSIIKLDQQASVPKGGGKTEHNILATKEVNLNLLGDTCNISSPSKQLGNKVHHF